MKYCVLFVCFTTILFNTKNTFEKEKVTLMSVYLYVSVNLRLPYLKVQIRVYFNWFIQGHVNNLTPL